MLSLQIYRNNRLKRKTSSDHPSYNHRHDDVYSHENASTMHTWRYVCWFFYRWKKVFGGLSIEESFWCPWSVCLFVCLYLYWVFRVTRTLQINEAWDGAETKPDSACVDVIEILSHIAVKLVCEKNALYIRIFDNFITSLFSLLRLAFLPT